MSGEEKRRSERAIPFVSDEEVVIIQGNGANGLIAKMMDLSEVGTLVYLIEEADLPGAVGSAHVLSVYHQGNVFEVRATIARKTGRLIAFNFVNPGPEALHEIQSKLIHMEIEWMRLNRRS